MRTTRLEGVLEAGVVLAALATVPITVAEEVGSRTPAVAVADWTVWLVFVAEYVILAAVAADRLAFARRSWLSLAVIVLSFPLMPSLLALVRLARLARLLRLLRLLAVTGRGVQALRAVLGRRGLIYVACVTAVLVLGGAGILTVLEPETVKGDIKVGLWWALVTVTTVGYGDVVPATVIGRLVGVTLMFAGVGLVSTLAASIAAYFIAQDESTTLTEVLDRLERIERALGQQRSPAGARAEGEEEPIEKRPRSRG